MPNSIGSMGAADGPHMAIGAVLARARRQAGLSAAALIAALGPAYRSLTASYVSQIERGRHLPRWPLVVDWLSVCGAGLPGQAVKDYYQRAATQQPRQYGQIMPGAMTGTAEAAALIRAWQAAETVESVAAALGWTVGRTRSLAYSLRRHGVALKRLHYRGRDYKVLSELARRAAPG